MIRAGAVTRFAAHTRFYPSRLESIVVCLKVFLKIRSVTFDAHVIGIVRRRAPMQNIIGRDAFIGIQMKPVLTTFFSGACIPCKRQTLPVAVWLRSQILLQGKHTKGVLQRELGSTGRILIGADAVLLIHFAKSSFLLMVFERRRRKVAYNIFGRGELHGLVVV